MILSLLMCAAIQVTVEPAPMELCLLGMGRLEEAPSPLIFPLVEDLLCPPDIMVQGLTCEHGCHAQLSNKAFGIRPQPAGYCNGCNYSIELIVGMYIECVDPHMTKYDTRNYLGSEECGTVLGAPDDVILCPRCLHLIGKVYAGCQSCPG